MVTIGLLIAVVAVIGSAYYCGNKIGYYDGFEEGMDAAIATYEEVLREEAVKA